MKYLIFLSMSFFLMNAKGQKEIDQLILIKKGMVTVYNIQTDEYLNIDNVPNEKDWKIGSVKLNSDTIIVLLYNELEYLNFYPTDFNHSKNTVINEKEYTLLKNNLSIVDIKSNKIYKSNGNLVIKTNDNNSKPLEINDYVHRYNYFKNSPYLVIDYSIYYRDKNEDKLFLQRKKESNLWCGYSRPDISPDKKRLVCDYSCSKYYNIKKTSEMPCLIEIDSENKNITFIGVQGFSPMYSLTGNVILYRDYNNYNLYEKNNEKTIVLEGVTQAMWIK